MGCLRRDLSGTVHVAFIFVLFSRRIVGWRAATRMTTDLVLDTLEHAIWTCSEDGVTDLSGLIHHNEAGSQYTSFAFTQRLIDAGVDPSVGSVGDAYDNAMAESPIGIYMTELIHPEGPWRGVDHVEMETLHWVNWFNRDRTHEFIDDRTPSRSNKPTTLQVTVSSRPGAARSEASGPPGRFTTLS